MPIGEERKIKSMQSSKSTEYCNLENGKNV